MVPGIRSRLRTGETTLILCAVVVVGIHVAGVGGMAYCMRQTLVQQSKDAVVKTVGDSLESFVLTLGNVDAHRFEPTQTALQHFNSTGIWDGLRIVDQTGRIVCSIRPEEVDTFHMQRETLVNQWPASMVAQWDHGENTLLEQVAFRVPLLKGIDQNEMLLEGVVRPARLLPATRLINPWTVGIFMGSTLLLVVLLAGLRAYLRPFTSIGFNLVRHREDLRQELSSLRLAGESHLVGQAWNQLISLFEELQSLASQTHAYAELHQAMEQTVHADLLEAVRTLPVGMMYVAEGQRLRFANTMSTRLTGIPVPEDGSSSVFSGMTLDQLRSCEWGEKIAEFIRSAWSGHHFDNKETTLTGGDGSAYSVRVLPVLSRRQGADAVVLVRDISQSYRAEKAREEFLAQVAHELRTPLTNIQAYSETLTEVRDDPKIQNECFNVINAETRRLRRLIEELLCRKQLDLGTIQIRRDNVDLMSLLTDAVRDLQAAAEHKSIELRAELPSKLPRLQADRDKLAVVFNNLLGNAIKYTRPNGRVWVTARSEDERVRVEVHDTGIGIAPEDQGKVFERMYRVDNPEVQKQAGNGLGLTTARDIVREHGGDITLSSEAGNGSTFTVDLPVEPSPVGVGT